jgi:putative FmdB family regulatory protein
MPTYEYLCQSCGHRFEAWQRITDDPLTECPNCSGHIRRVLFPAGIVFKGSGFYKTDSRGSASSAAATSGESNGKGETPSESSPAAKASETKTTEAKAPETPAAKTAD